MTRYSCKSYFDDDAQEQRWAVERQDGNVYRVLQRCFITKEGSQVWLDRYISIKKQFYSIITILRNRASGL